MRRILACALFTLLTAQLASAEVSLTERRMLHQQLAKAGQPGKDKLEHARRGASPGRATGSQALIDASGLKYFLNTNITFTTTHSASGAFSEASYTHAVAATTLNGGTTSSTLDDAFDGYGGLCLGFNGATGPCGGSGGGGRPKSVAVGREKGGIPDYIVYNQNGPATSECGGRQFILPNQVVNLGTTTLQVSRKVLVPANDTFARWLNVVTNTGAAAATFNVITANNLGSDNSGTTLVTSSNGNNTAEASDTWLTSFQQFGVNCEAGPNISCDPRLGHVFQGPGAVTPMSFIHFVDGNDSPYWDYNVTLNPGQTKIIMTFVTAQPSKAAAAAKAAQLVGLPANAVQCLTPAERTAIINFGPVAPPVPTLGQTGLVALGLLLAGFALLILRRRSAVA